MDMITQNWRPKLPAHAGILAAAIAKGIAGMEQTQRAVLPDLRSAKSLGLACDFSGQHDRSQFDTYAFVLFNADEALDWRIGRQLVREHLIRDDRRIAFKNLRDNVQWKALEPFLAVAGQLHGVLLTLSIDKRFQDEFVVGSGFRLAEFEDRSRFSSWKPSSALKAAWGVHTAAILVAGLAGSGQDVHWMIDRDEIIEPSERRQDLSDSFKDVLSDYLDFQMGGFEILSPEDDPGTLTVEDLLSVADLAAGAWATLFSTVDSARDREHLQQLLASKPERSRKKVEMIVEWCSQNTRRNLKYMNIALSPGDDEMPVYGQFMFPQRSA